MSWAKNIRRMLGCVAAAAVMLAPGHALAGIVVASSGPSAAQFPVGKKMSDRDRVTLKAGDTVTILDKGGTKILRGPRTVTIGAVPAPKRSSTFAALTRERSAQRVRTGAVRGQNGSTNALRPNLWYIDIAAPGTMCVLEGQELRLWRAQADQAGTVPVMDDKGETIMRAEFEKDSMIAVWDAVAAPVSDGSSFSIGSGEIAGRTSLTFALLPEKPGNPEDLVQVLIDRGCTAQLGVLTRTLGGPSIDGEEAN